MVGGYEIVSFIHSLLKERFTFRAEIKPDGKLYRFDISGSIAEQIMQWIYSSNGTCLQRKYDKWQEWLKLKEEIVRSSGESPES